MKSGATRGGLEIAQWSGRTKAEKTKQKASRGGAEARRQQSGFPPSFVSPLLILFSAPPRDAFFVGFRWPDPDRPQQFHIDVTVDRDELDAAEAKVLAAGATKHEQQPGETDGWRVYVDPSGHPFCLCWD